MTIKASRPGQTIAAEGRVTVALSRNPGDPVRVGYKTVGDICGLLCGLTPDKAITVIAALHAVCVTAQSHAAVTALESAMGIVPTRQTAAARALLSMMERLREHLLKIMMAWPDLVPDPAVPSGPCASGDGAIRNSGQDPHALRTVAGLLARLNKALCGADNAFRLGASVTMGPDQIRAADLVIRDAATLVEEHVLGEPVARFLKRRGRCSVAFWAENTSTPAARLLAALMARGQFEEASSGDRDGTPSVSEQASSDATSQACERSEATLFVRYRDDPLVTSLMASGVGARLVARLVDCARLSGEMRAVLEGRSDPPLGVCHGDGRATGRIDAARGELVHEVQVRPGRVVSYRILPPTLVNFHADGVAARCLNDITVTQDDERMHLAHLVVHAIDPCVAYDVRLG